MGISKKARLKKAAEMLRAKLWLQDWHIQVALMTREEIDDILSKSKSKYGEDGVDMAFCGVSSHRRSAFIGVSDEAHIDDIEFLVGHEMTHIKLDALFESFESNPHMTILLEQIVDDIADAIVGGKVDHVTRSYSSDQ